jgi:hypothetical protein
MHFNLNRIIMFVESMTTISVRDETRRSLLLYASKLQLSTGRKVDFDDAIRHLLERDKRPDLLEEACRPIPNSDWLQKLLHEERGKDDDILERHIRG